MQETGPEPHRKLPQKKVLCRLEEAMPTYHNFGISAPRVSTTRGLKHHGIRTSQKFFFFKRAPLYYISSTVGRSCGSLNWV